MVILGVRSLAFFSMLCAMVSEGNKQIISVTNEANEFGNRNDSNYVGNDFIDDNFYDEEFVDNSFNSPFRSIVKEKVKTDIKDIRNVLKSEMEEMSPELNEKIASTINNSKIDRKKFRDIFLIKKRIITDGDKKIVSFDIQERVIPREPTLSQITENKYTSYLFIGILILLSSLVLTTTMKMYQSLIKLKYIENNIKEIPI